MFKVSIGEIIDRKTYSVVLIDKDKFKTKSQYDVSSNIDTGTFFEI